MRRPHLPAPALQIENLSKSYHGRDVFKAMNLAVAAGEIFALLGGNGAGKTTLIECVTGLKEADSGTIRVLGQPLAGNERALRAAIGLVPQELALEQFETVLQAMRFTRRLFGLMPDASLCDHLLETLALADKRHALVGELSGGMKRRLLIAKALYHEPAILFLDEPTAGVDISLREDLWRTVLKLRDSGKTIILTTHYLEEAEMLADSVAVLHSGKLVGPRSKAEFLAEVGGLRISAKVEGHLSRLPPSLARSGFTLEPKTQSIMFENTIRADAAEGLAQVAQCLTDAGLRLVSISAEEPTFEGAFRALTRDQP